ncbi:HigA family addiction module antitoxin [Staphylococcus aureus]|uniref:HigA family addiction module antitoxin n=1 Tax=Staphylococcus aureus TaxID=1280 RepID=UPI001C531795
MNNPAHAGELVSEWLDGLKEEGQAITITELAERIQVTRPLLSRIINGKAPVTADVALRLHDALGISADLLMRVQSKSFTLDGITKTAPTDSTIFVNC